MKTQFATIEATISLLFVLAITLFAEISVNSTGGLYLSKKRLTEDIAIYDLVNQLAHNLSMENCMNNYIENGSRCMDNFINYYKSAYGLSFLKVIYNSSTYEDTNYIIRCFPYNGKTNELCAEVN